MAQWRPRFRLRTLLIVTAICGLFLAPVAVEFNQQRREQAIIERLTEAGRSSQPFHSWAFTRSTSWYRDRVTDVSSVGPLSGDDIDALSGLSRIRSLQIVDATLSQSDVEGLARLIPLESLDLSSCRLPDNLQPLAQLRNLKSLQLQNTGVTEAAIVELQELKPGLDVLDD